jgi:general secretion pathway protein G
MRDLLHQLPRHQQARTDFEFWIDQAAATPWTSKTIRRIEAGFSLIELMAVLSILAILATAAIPMAQLVAKHSKEHELRQDLRQLREAIDTYKQAVNEGHIAKKSGESGYPPKLDDLVNGVDDLRDPNKSKIYFLRRIPTDPMAPSGMTESDSWAKRSYASPPDDPREENDVYDIYSRSEEIGLNGIPYRQW